MSVGVERLEILRREGQYGPLLRTIESEGLEKDRKALPIAIDAARGLIQRSVSPQKIKKIDSRLMGIGGNYLNSSSYINEVDGDDVAAISHRRDLSRLFLAIDPVVSSRNFSLREVGKQLLYEASRRASRDDWRKCLMLIERQNMEAKNGHRVNIDDTVELLGKILHETEHDADRDRAVTTWAVETALLQRHGIKDILNTINEDMPLAEELEIVTRAELRLLQAESRDSIIHMLNPTLSKKNRDEMKEELKAIGDLWTGSREV